MKIGELSKRTGVSIRSIRHYEKKNLIYSKRLDNGYRVFDDSTVKDIKTIQLYLSLGLNTDQIKEILECSRQNPQYNGYEACEDLLETYKKKYNEVLNQLKSLSELERKLFENIQALSLSIEKKKELKNESK